MASILVKYNLLDDTSSNHLGAMNFSVFFYLVLIIPFMESSSLQASVGELLFKIEVVTNENKRIGDCFIRSLYLFMSFILPYLTVFIYLYHFIKFKSLVHDTATNSKVILSPSFKEIFARLRNNKQ